MPDALRESVDEHREALEEWADSDLPLAEEIGTVLDKADAAEAEATS